MKDGKKSRTVSLQYPSRQAHRIQLKFHETYRISWGKAGRNHQGFQLWEKKTMHDDEKISCWQNSSSSL